MAQDKAQDKIPPPELVLKMYDIPDALNNIDWKKLAELGLLLNGVDWEIFIPEFNGPEKRYKGTLKVASPDDAIELCQIIYRQFAGSRNEAIDNAEHWDNGFPDDHHIRVTAFSNYNGYIWLHELDTRKQRVAPPGYRVFIHSWGRDCDGISLCEYHAFPNLEKAIEAMDEMFRWADGPMNYTTISAEDYEQGEYPEFRDPYAERMGY